MYGSSHREWCGGLVYNYTMRSRRSGGQATLSFIILVSGIILESAIAGSFVTYYLSTSGLGERLSYRALAAAEAGIRDAEIAIARNKELGSASYSFSVGSDSVSLVITRDSVSDPTNYIYTIASTGIASTRQRKLVGAVAVDKTTGVIQVQSVVEQALQ